MPILQKKLNSAAFTSFPIGPTHVTTLAESIQEFVIRYGGEWRVVPMEPLVTPAVTSVAMGVTSGTGSTYNATHPTGRPRIGGFDAYTDLVGNQNTDNAHLTFEYGVPRSNVASYTFNVDRQQIANYIYVPRVGFPEPGRVNPTPHVNAEDPSSKTALGMRYDAWVDPGEITLTAQRQALADNHRNLRAGPRRIISFVPTVNAEIQPWVDYEVGDYVFFRAFDGDTLRLDLLVRIYGITANIDDQGNESVTVATSEEAAP